MVPLIDGFLSTPVYRRGDVLSISSPVPRRAGIYAWFFRQVPTQVPLNDCILRDGMPLLYVGIAPKAPPTNGAKPSTQTLWHRIRYHYRGNAEGSTLRLTLGCLLSEELGIELRRVGSGKRMTFGDGEQTLSSWMSENAFVCWQEASDPWIAEHALINELSLPLNLQGNQHHHFHAHLSMVRARAKSSAFELSIVNRQP